MTRAANPGTSVAYLGFAERGNLGDDAIAEAFERALPTAGFEPLPLYPRDLGRYVRSGRLRRLRGSPVLLGGGTVIGRRNWRAHLAVARLLVPTRPLLMLGAGVEDPTFQGRHSFSGNGELRRWRSILAEFDAVTVRGPRSAELLADIGVEASIVGDPALLLEPPLRPVGATQPIGVCLGWGDDLWGHDPAALSAGVADSLRMLRADGHEIRMLVVNSADREYVVNCAEQAGLDASAIVTATRTDDYLAAVGDCSVVVAERLHGAVLAAACGVPTVALEYQPKCLDFMRSIGLHDLSVRTDQVDAAKLADLVRYAVADRDRLQTRLIKRVDQLRDHQRSRLDAWPLEHRALEGQPRAA